MNLIRSLFFVSAATVAANGVQAFVAPSARAVESPSATRLQAFGSFGKKAPKKATGVGAPGFGAGSPGKKVAVRRASGGFKLGGGAGKKAAAPVKASSGTSGGIVRGFSKQWNPTVVKEGGIKKGFSKQYNPR